MGEVIQRELRKRLTFDHTNKCYTHNPEWTLENKTHKILWDFKIRTVNLIPLRRPDVVFINKKKEFVILKILLFQQTT